MDAWLQGRAEADEFSSTVLIRCYDETIFEGAYGWAVHRGRGLQLVGQQRLSLDASITDLVDLAGTTINTDVTLRHLLTHTSGIADDADEEAGESYEALFVDRPSYSLTKTADFLPLFAHKPALAAPGQQCRYCNTGYVLVGLAIEAKAGMTYREYVRDNVFAAIGMTESGFYDRREAGPMSPRTIW